MRLRAAPVSHPAADGRAKADVMSAFMDQVVGVYGFLGFFAATLAHYEPSVTLVPYGGTALLFLALFLVARFKPWFYKQHRNLFILLFKGTALLLPGRRVHFRLHHEPTGKPIQDLFSAALGEWSRY